ncbi:MAG: ATP-binding cassette domain-containing protein [Micrococcus sp.]|nr:ATP-binding cassette domain-containing protein [Micrococcus sp.]
MTTPSDVPMPPSPTRAEADDARPIILHVESVTKHFPSAERPALDDVSVQVRSGDFLAIVGPSGSGKSTLLNVLGLLDRADSGTYRIEGHDVATLSESGMDALRSRVFGFVFQSSHVLGDETVAANAALGLRIQNVPLAERDSRAHEALELLGLTHRRTARSALLSGGERQRLAIARAVATAPRVLLADEPTGNLDTANSRRVMAHLRELNAAGTTVVMITHDPDIAASADRRVSITDGVLREDTPRPLQRSSLGRTGTADGVEAVPPRLPRRAAWRDDVVDAVSALSARFLRTVLLMCAFAVGIGGLIGAMGLSQTATAQVSARLSAAALDEVTVTLPDDPTLLAPDDGRLARWRTDLAALDHVVAAGHVASISPADVTITRLRPDEPEPATPLSLAGMSSSFADLAGLTFSTPASAQLLDDPHARLAWLTPSAAAALNVPAPTTGDVSPGYRVWIDGQEVDVAGIVRTGERTPTLSASVIVTPAVITDLPLARPQLTLRTDVGFPYPVAQATPLVIAPEAPGSVTVGTVADLRSLRAGISDDLGAFVGVLSLVLLVLAVISASTTMYLSVQARTAEIALRRAIGASRSVVARLFLVEGAVIGLFGGAVGAAVGTAVILAASHARDWSPVLPGATIPVSLGLGVLAGVLSALYPAWVASRKRPADALRG